MEIDKKTMKFIEQQHDHLFKQGKILYSNRSSFFGKSFLLLQKTEKENLILIINSLYSYWLDCNKKAEFIKVGDLYNRVLFENKGVNYSCKGFRTSIFKLHPAFIDLQTLFVYPNLVRKAKINLSLEVLFHRMNEEMNKK